jgi:protein farnesyltransferase subunit beta
LFRLAAVFTLLTSPTADGALKDSSAPRPPLGEAHGGYTFCATASWVLLQPYLKTHYTSPAVRAPKIKYAALLRWLTHMQGGEIELGGFKGRTNKLVDGCYSWWVGGCVALLEGLLGIEKDASDEKASEGEEDHTWDDVDGMYRTRRD